MKLLLITALSLFAFEAHSKLYKCTQKEIKKSFGFFIGEDTTPPPTNPQVIKVQGKKIAIKELTETYKIISKSPILNSSDIEEVVTIEHEVNVYKNGEYVKKDPPDLALQFKLKDSGKEKLSRETAANIGKLLVLKVDKEVLFLPSIYSKLSGQSFVYAPGEFESTYAKLKSLCSSEPLEIKQ